MRNLLLTLILTSASLAHAQWRQDELAALFNQERLPQLLALDCPGAPGLQLKDLADWRAGGDKITGNFETIKARGEKLISTAAFFLFAEGTAVTLKNAEFSTGQISGNGGGSPGSFHGCKALPLAIDASALRDGPPYMVNSTVYDRLLPLDKWVAAQLLKGFKADVLRTFLDDRVAQMSPVDRLNLLKQRNIFSMNYQGVEILLKNVTIEDGQIAWATLADNEAKAYFSKTGQLRFLKDIDYGKYVATRLSPDTKLLTGKGRFQCSRASFRVDGTLSTCDGHYIDRNGNVAFESRGVLYPISYEGESLRTERYANEKDNYREAVAISDVYGTGAPIKLRKLEKPLNSVVLVVGDQVCETLSVTNVTSEDPGLFAADIVVPVGCAAGVKLIWGESKPKKAAVEEEPTPTPKPKKKKR